MKDTLQNHPEASANCPQEILMCSDPVTALRLDYKLSEAGALCLAQWLKH